MREIEAAMEGAERTLLARAQTGDRDAFCALAARYERRVYALARHYCHDAADAEDLAQEVWLRAFRALATFRGEASFYTWLRHIAVNVCLNHRRGAAHRGRARTLSLTEFEFTADQPAAVSGAASEATLNDRLLVGQVEAALAELPPQQRLVFLLKHHEGLTYEEIGVALGCAPGTAQKALHRALAKLRARLCPPPVVSASAAPELVPCPASKTF